ncbi:MAG: tetratricopeptide repeat protein, partial [Planctomycetota bacterium]
MAAHEVHQGISGQWKTVDPKKLDGRPISRAGSLASVAGDNINSIEKPAQKSAPSANDTLARRQSLETHLRSHPTDQEAYLELAAIYRAENRPVDARRVLQQAVQLFPDDEVIRWEFEEATLARSLNQLREVTDLASRVQNHQTELELQRAKEDWAQRRIEVCKARVSRQPEQEFFRLSLGEAQFDADQFESAAETLGPLIDSREHAPAANLIIAKSLLAQRQELDAMKALRRA